MCSSTATSSSRASTWRVPPSPLPARCLGCLGAVAGARSRPRPARRAQPFVEGWTAAFPRNDILFMRTEDYVANTSFALNEVFKHLGMLPLQPGSQQEAEVLRKQVVRGSRDRQPEAGQIAPATAKKLREFFAPYNRRAAPACEWVGCRGVRAGRVLCTRGRRMAGGAPAGGGCCEALIAADAPCAGGWRMCWGGRGTRGMGSWARTRGR